MKLDRRYSDFVHHLIGVVVKNLSKATALAAAGMTLVGALALAGCSSSSSSSTSSSAAPTESKSESKSAAPTESKSASPSASQSSFGSKGTLQAGDIVQIQGGSTYSATGGTVVLQSSDGKAGTLEVAATGGGNDTGDWMLKLVVNDAGQVQSGTLVSPDSEYKVTEPSGVIEPRAVQGQNTLVTTTPIKVQRGTETPTTMTLSITYKF